MRRCFLLIIALAVLVSGTALARTTGDLKGTVTDSDGAPLPGATVTISSPSQLGGDRFQQTGADGSFNFPAIDPGFYVVKVELEGFVSQEKSEVQVLLDRTTDLKVSMKSGEFSETMMVTAESAVIDPEQVSVAQNYTETYLQKSTVGTSARSYQRVLGQTAGVTGGSNPNVLGSTGGENAWYIDGFNTTDPVTSTFGSNYAFDAIQEISLETTGFEAEFGNATGGVVNVITKSGGNDFSGSLDIRYFDESYFENGEFFDRELSDQKQLNPSATLGGPLLRDKLWFFTAYNGVETDRTAPGAPTTRTFNGDYWLGKLSWQLNPSWRVVLKGNGDPASIDNASFSTAQFRPPEAQRRQEQGGDLFQIDANGVLTSNLLWDSRAGVSRSDLSSFPISGDLETPGFFNVSNNQYSVNFRNAQFSDRDRDFFNSSLSWFVDDFGGSHEFKGGVEADETYFRTQNFTVGDYSFTRRIVNGADIPRNFTFNPNRDATDFDGSITTLYAQDSWSVTPNVTLKLGVRYDESQFDDNLGAQTASLDKLQPRFGLAWDLTGEGKTIARASWGRFMHPSALTAASFAERGANTLPRTTAWSCDYIRQFTFGLPASDTTPCTVLAPIIAAAFGWNGDIIQEPQGLDPEGWIVQSIIGGAGVPNVVSPNLDATYQDSLVLGIEHQIARRTSLELTYVDKETDDIFEDTCDGAFPNPVAGHSCNFYFMANLPGLRREYQGVLLRLESRATDWLHINSSITWSESKGNVEYTQNTGSDFDFFPDHYDNRFGFLADHRDWRVKINGYIDLPLDFSLGFDAFWSSDSVFDQFVTAENSPYGVRYTGPRGSIDGNENYQLDLAISKSFNIGSVDLQLIGSVLNVFDSERPIDRCERGTGCGEVQGVERNLGDPIDWQLPRQYEVGFRITF